MATRLKTVHFAFPIFGGTTTNNALAQIPQLTIYLPETGTKTFRSVMAHVTCDDIITATGGSITTKTLSLRLGAAGYTTVANANTLTNSGENMSIWLVQDFTSHFVTNWSGTSMTCDFQVTLNQSTGTTTGFNNLCVTLEITYEYDDTSTTQVKSVMIPLNMPTGAMDTAATTRDTIPALDTYLPEASKVYRNIHIVVQNNEQRNGAVTDHQTTLRVGAASVLTGIYVGALASDRMTRYVWECTTAWPSTAATQTWQPTCSVARCHHSQAYLVVTYEYNESTSTTIMNSLMLPMEVNSPFGGTAATDYQRATRELWIQEPGPITTQRVAFFVFWQQSGALAGINFRIGTGSFVAYTDASAMTCGADPAMIRNDAAFTFARGRNSLNFDGYRTSTADIGWNISGYWMINYTSAKHANGSGVHNKTVLWGLLQNGTGAAIAQTQTTALAVTIPESQYFMTAVGTRNIMQSTGTSVPTGFVTAVERLTGEGGLKWEDGYRDVAQSDAELGVFFAYSQMRDVFVRWPGDPDTTRLALGTARRWRLFAPLYASGSGSMWPSLALIFTYHSITFSCFDGVFGFTGTVNITLHRASGEKVLATSRSGDGTFLFDWYDNTEGLFASADDGVKVGRSALSLAS